MALDTISTLGKPFRDDIKGGIFLNKRLNNATFFGSFDYKNAECYHLGNPSKIVVAYCNHVKIPTGYMAEVALAADGFRFSKKSLAILLGLYFNRNKKNVRLQALIPIWNKQAIRLAELSGFKCEGRLRKVAKDGDRYLYSLLREEYLKNYVRDI